MSIDWPDFNDLWNYDDPAATEATFRGLLADTAHAPDPGYRRQLLTQIARTLGLQGRFDAGHAVLDQLAAEIRDAAQSQEDVVTVRLLLERGRLFNSAGDPETAVPLFERAYALAHDLGADFYTVDALHMLGVAAPPAARLGWNQQAIAYARQSAQPRARKWLGSLYNNTGWTLFEEGRYEEALDLFQQALAFRRAHGPAAQLRIARWCVAKALRYLDQVPEALAIQQELAAAGPVDGFIAEELAECLLALDRPAEARPYFRTAYEALRQIDWVAADTARLERLQAMGTALPPPPPAAPGSGA